MYVCGCVSSCVRVIACMCQHAIVRERGGGEGGREREGGVREGGREVASK